MVDKIQIPSTSKIGCLQTGVLNMKLEYEFKGLPNPGDTKLTQLVTQPFDLYKNLLYKKGIL